MPENILTETGVLSRVLGLVGQPGGIAGLDNDGRIIGSSGNHYTITVDLGIDEEITLDESYPEDWQAYTCRLNFDRTKLKYGDVITVIFGLIQGDTLGERENSLTFTITGDNANNDPYWSVNGISYDSLSTNSDLSNIEIGNNLEWGTYILIRPYLNSNFKFELNERLENYVDTDTFNVTLTNYVTKTALTSSIAALDNRFVLREEPQPVEFVTQAEYDDASTAKRPNTLYVITDASF